MRDAPVIGLGIDGKSQADAEIAAIAGRQHGVVTRRQLLEIGIGSGAVEHRLRCGRLHPVFSGVYAVGHRSITADGWLMGAVLSMGPGAVASHRSAAAVWRIRSSGPDRVDVTTARSLRARRGVRPHQSALALDEVTVEHGIPVTTPSRTLLDLAAVLDRDRLERAFEQAEVLRLGVGPSVPALLKRYPRRQGSGALKAILAEHRLGEDVTDSVLEERFLAFLRRHNLQRPATNVWLQVAKHRFRVDCLWRAHCLIVELDGRAAHSTRASFERDRARDRALAVAGWRAIRITWRHLHDQPAALADDLAALLAPDKLNI